MPVFDLTYVQLHGFKRSRFSKNSFPSLGFPYCEVIKGSWELKHTYSPLKELLHGHFHEMQTPYQCISIICQYLICTWSFYHHLFFIIPHIAFSIIYFIAFILNTWIKPKTKIQNTFLCCSILIFWIARKTPLLLTAVKNVFSTMLHLHI